MAEGCLVWSCDGVLKEATRASLQKITALDAAWLRAVCRIVWGDPGVAIEYCTNRINLIGRYLPTSSMLQLYLQLYLQHLRP
jgi:hypothetical protein